MRKGKDIGIIEECSSTEELQNFIFGKVPSAAGELKGSTGSGSITRDWDAHT